MKKKLKIKQKNLSIKPQGMSSIVEQDCFVIKKKIISVLI